MQARVNRVVFKIRGNGIVEIFRKVLSGYSVGTTWGVENPGWVLDPEPNAPLLQYASWQENWLLANASLTCARLNHWGSSKVTPAQQYQGL